MRPLACFVSLLLPLPLLGEAGLVALHGKIWTEDPKQPAAQAIAVSGHRIVAVGSGAAVQALVGPQRLRALGVVTNFGNDTLPIGSPKAFADGSQGSATTWFRQPFEDQPGNSGGPTESLARPEEFFAEMKAADRAGNHLAVHAMPRFAHLHVTASVCRCDAGVQAAELHV